MVCQPDLSRMGLFTNTPGEGGIRQRQERKPYAGAPH